MGRFLVCGLKQKLKLTKHKALGYKDVDLSALSNGSCFNIEPQGKTLVGVSAEGSINDEPIYSVLTKEFGLYALSQGVEAKVRVSFLDEGLMLVDVFSGAILVKPAEDVLLASRGLTVTAPVILNEILWVDATKLLSCITCWTGSKSKYTQDFEYMLTLQGEKKGELDYFSMKHLPDETLDISDGAIATLEINAKNKADAKQAVKAFDNLLQATSEEGLNFEGGEAEDFYSENDEEFDDSDY